MILIVNGYSQMSWLDERRLVTFNDTSSNASVIVMNNRITLNYNRKQLRNANI
jgi:hypothetical protein